MRLAKVVPAVAIAGVFSVACGGGGCHTSVSKSWDASYGVSFGGGGAPDASLAAAPADASVTAVSEAGVADSSAPRMLGIFHSDVGPDERNLEIDPDGTFFWRIYGCDFGGGDCGVWSVDGTALVLTPKPPATTMTWDDGVGFNRKVTKVVLRDKGATVEARVFAADGEKLLQAWFPGRICATCSGGGPSGKLLPCAKPLTKSCP